MENQQVIKAQNAYRRIGQMFLDAADKMNAAMIEDILSGAAQKFWAIEVERELWKVSQEVRNGQDEV